MNSRMQIYEEYNDESTISVFLRSNDLRFVVDEELATINFNIWTELKMVFLARAPYCLIYCVWKLACRSFDLQLQSHI